MKGHVAQELEEQFAHIEGRDGRACHIEEVQQFLARPDHHAQKGDLGQRRAQAGYLRPQLPPVEGPRHDGTTPVHAPRRIGMIIGEERAKVELQRGVVLEERHRLGARLKKGIHAGGIEMRARLMFQIGPRLGRAVIHTCAHRRPVAGNPHPAARPRRGAAEHRLFLHHQHLKAAMGGGDSRRQPARTRTYHQYIHILACHLVNSFLQADRYPPSTGSKAPVT